jgi:hypothetical protein
VEYKIWRHLSNTDKKGDIILGKTIANENRYVDIMPIYF